MKRDTFTKKSSQKSFLLHLHCNQSYDRRTNDVTLKMTRALEAYIACLKLAKYVLYFLEITSYTRVGEIELTRSLVLDSQLPPWSNFTNSAQGVNV